MMPWSRKYSWRLDPTYWWKRKVKVWVVQLCPTLCNSMDCSPPSSSVRGISQARILEWLAISFSRGSFWPRDWTWVSCLAGGFFTTESPEKPSSNYHLFSSNFVPETGLNSSMQMVNLISDHHYETAMLILIFTEENETLERLNNLFMVFLK